MVTGVQTCALPISAQLTVSAPVLATPAQGTVSLNADGTINFTPASGVTGLVTITYTLTDSSGAFTTGTLQVNVGASTNTPPTAVNDAASTSQDAALAISPASLTANDTDADGNPLTITSVQSPNNGTVALVAGTLVFTPTPGYTGPASFTYTISDGFGGSSTATVNIAVNAVVPINSPPVAANDVALATNEDTATTISTTSLLGNDTDINGDSLTITSVQGANNGSVSLVAGQIIFTPNLNYNGPASFTYTISDGKGGTSTATVNLTVTPVNDPPVALDDLGAFIDEDSTLTILPSTLFGNDFDLDGDALSISSVQSATNGTVALVGGKIVFTPTANYNGPASFSYTISDGHGGFSTATVNITVNPVNDPPVAVNDTAPATDEDTATTIIASSLLRNDTDVEGDPLVLSSVQNAINGTATLVAGNVLFTPDSNYNGPASFTYTISDGHGGFSTATVNIAVNPVNDAPVAVGDTAPATDEDTATTITATTLLRNDRDIDGDLLTITSVQNATGGAVTLQAGNIVFTPAADFNGPASFTYTVSDGNGGVSTATVNLTVTPVNDLPVALNDTGLITPEDTDISIAPAALLGNDSDVDRDPLAVISVQDAINGNVALIAGKVVFTPNANYNGPASFNYTISDGNGGLSTATVNLTVTPVNDVPVAVNDTISPINEDSATTINAAILLSNDTDVERDPLTIISVQGATNGTVALVSGNILFTPNPAYSGPASFAYTISDGQGGISTATVNLRVNPLPRLPVSPLQDGSGFNAERNPIPSLPGFTTVADPALFVSFSINESRSGFEFNSGMGLFHTDSVTLAELTAGLQSDLTFAEGNQFGSRGLGGKRVYGESIDNATFVQHAVRHQSLGTDRGLFVHDAVRGSQLESLARNMRVHSFNSANPGVATLLDPFALSAPLPALEPAASAKDAETKTSVSPTQAEVFIDVVSASRNAEMLPDASLTNATSTRPPARHAAASFGAQLRRSASEFRPRLTRTEVPALGHGQIVQVTQAQGKSL